jgi:PAS domain S-box-containing protein
MSDWQSAMGMLERDASLAPYLRQAAIFIWSLDGKVVLVADGKGEDLRSRLGEGFGERARERMRLMGQGLAPVSGVRLERLALSPNPSHPPLTCACRRIRLASGQEGLLVLAQTAGLDLPAPAPEPAAQEKMQPASFSAEPAIVAPAVGNVASQAPIPDLVTQNSQPMSALAAPDPVAQTLTGYVVAEAPPVPVSRDPVNMPRRMRFVWSSDAEGRVTGLSPVFLDLLRLDSPDQIIGQSWQELIGSQLRDAQGALAAGLASQATFSEAQVLFRIGKTNGAITTAMSGSPVFAAGREFQGFRGFGALKPAAEMASTAKAPQESAVEPDKPDSPSFEVAEPAPVLDHPAPAHSRRHGDLPEISAPTIPTQGALADAVSDPVAVQPPQPAGNDDLPPRLPAVATLQSRLPDMLRQGQPEAQASPNPPASVPPALRPVLAPAKADLTPAEKQAFRQIAEALGAEIAETTAPQQEQPSSTAEMPRPAADLSAPETPASEAATPDAPLPQMAPADLQDAADEAESTPAALSPPVEPPRAEVVSIAPPPQAAPASPRPSFAAAAHALAQDVHAELLDKLPIGVLVSRNGEVAYGNRTFLDLLGYDDLADIVRHGGMENLFRGRAPDEGGGAVLLVAKDGDLETVEARLSAIAWQGRPATLMSFRRAIEADAPARARALELDLDASRKRLGELSSILDTATDGVVTLDDRGRILSLNGAAEALFGYDQREVTGEIISMLFAPESHAPAMDYLDGLKGGGVASVLNDGREVVGMVRQGGRVPLFMTMGRIADGADAKFCAVLRDITAWKKAESELTEARKAAEQASAQKSDVLAKISHEIRTPLNAIIGFSEVMAEERFGPIGSERYREYARDIRESGNYLISLVNDLLDLAKIEAGRLDLDFESVNLNDIANAAVSLLQPEAARNRVVLRTGLSTRLPPVVADERSLRQIVINLLSNAVKFTDSGGQVIVSTALGDKGEAILRVRDTGIGMTPDQLKLALEPFRQVSATRRGGGTGLGLPLTKALVEANRGAFQISSVPKEGTLAEVVFPPQRVLAG